MKIELKSLKSEEIDYLSPYLEKHKGLSFSDLVKCLDIVWTETNCDKSLSNANLTKFYSHPVWILNGIFSETDDESIKNRNLISELVLKLKPLKVADFGGGFGAFARILAKKNPNLIIHVIEPHPNNLSIKLSEQYENLQYCHDFESSYDCIIAMDVFEHLKDPLVEVERVGRFIRDGGYFLIANNFSPVIKCHLPSNFHYKYSWEKLMSLMNLTEVPTLTGEIPYGSLYQKIGNIDSKKAKMMNLFSKISYPLLEILPSRIKGRICNLIFSKK
jgi:ubiquinone/menaquinone biosynthesis C-methylase UbiE